MMTTIHRFLGLIVFLLGLVFILLSVVVPDIPIVGQFFNHAGTALLVLGVLELLFKSYLQ